MGVIREDQSEFLLYDIPDFPVYFRKNNIHADTLFEDMAVHWHDEVEIICVVSGRVGYLLNGEELELSEGDVLFINSRQLHVCVQKKCECELYCLIFHPALLCASAAMNQCVTSVISESAPYLLLNREDKRAKTIFSETAAIEGYNMHKPTGRIATMQSIYGLWLGIYRAAVGCRPIDAAQGGDLSVVRQMMCYAQENYAGRVTLQDLCRAGNVGRTKCTQLFARYLNTTPMEYLRNLRIENSIRMMEKGMRVSEAGLNSGFSDVSHFSKAFSLKTGKSPRQYMRQKKGEEE